MRIAGVDVKLNDKKDAVDLTIAIDEGAPVIVDEVRFEGSTRSRQTRTLRGRPSSRPAARSRDHQGHPRPGARLLRDNGRPFAKIEVTESCRRIAAHRPHRAREPGRRPWGVTIAGLETVGENVVRRELAFKPAICSESALTNSQQRLVELGLFEFAHVAPVTEPQTAPQVPLKVTVTEAPARELRVSAGYGSEERLRGSIRWSHLNFFGGARHATADAKYSSIDRGAKFSFIEPYFLRRGVSFNLSGTAWHTNELTYDSSTVGGRATVAYHSHPGVSGIREATHREIRVGYVHEYLRYGITSGFEDQTLRSERIALGLDPDTGRGAGTLSALDLDIERVAVDDALNPHEARSRTSMPGRVPVSPWRVSLPGADARRPRVPPARPLRGLGEPRADRLAVRDICRRHAVLRPLLSRRVDQVRGWGRFELSP